MLKIEKNDGTVISEKILNCDSFFKRALGLMFRSRLENFDGILLAPCSSIHTFFMKMDIDCFFLSGENKVLKVIWRMGPSRLSGFVKGCRKVLELAPGTIGENSIGEGDTLIISEMINK